MQTLPLEYSSGHLFVTAQGERWLLDTGSPTSIGRAGQLELDGTRFPLRPSLLGLDIDSLVTSVGEPFSGLIGTDILGRLDLEIDLPSGLLKVSDSPLDVEGCVIELEAFMGVPLVHARSTVGSHRMFFDTGAQLSYFNHPSLDSGEPAGEVRDFYPTIGEFHTTTYRVAFRIGSAHFSLRCGRLPELLSATLAMAGAEGIIGNESCVGRKVGYLARRGRLVLG